MAEGLLDPVVEMFVKPDGGLKWRALTLTTMGVLAGGYFLPSMGIAQGMPIVAGMVGGLAGLMVAGVAEKMKPEAETPEPDPHRVLPPTAVGHAQLHDMPSPGATPRGRPAPPGPQRRSGR